jgi:hypothetical protein
MEGCPGQRGQAAVEYVALLAVLAVLLAAAGAVAAGGAAGVANRVVGQVRHALCVVTGAACGAAGPAPCVVAAGRDRRRAGATIWVLRLDQDRAVLRERLSDGTVRLTLAEHAAAGLQAGLGAHGRVALGAGRTIGLGGELRATVMGLLGHGRVFHASDDRAADRILRAVRRGGGPAALVRRVAGGGAGALVGRVLGDGGGPRGVVGRVLGGGAGPRGIAERVLGGGGGPRADEVFVEGGLGAMAEAGVRAPGLGAELWNVADAVLGARLDRRAGTTTVYLRAGDAGRALAGAALGVRLLGGGADGRAMLALTLDRDRRARELALLSSGAVDGGAGLPGPAGLLRDPGAAAGAGPSAGADPSAGGRGRAREPGGGATLHDLPVTGRRWEVDARLDLADPAAAAAWAAYRRAPLSPAAIRALGERLRARAALDVRAYRVAGSTRGVSAGIAAGPGVGGELEHAVERADLVAAASRPAGGAWELRTECVGGVTA